MNDRPQQFTQPDSFAFSPENMAHSRTVIARYPDGRQASAVMPLLDLAQRQSGGWLPRAAMEQVAGILDMAPIRVYEVATPRYRFPRTPGDAPCDPSKVGIQYY